jgi:hypothetical protein
MESLSSQAYTGLSSQNMFRLRAELAGTSSWLARADSGRAHDRSHEVRDCPEPAAKPDEPKRSTATEHAPGAQNGAALSYRRSERTTLFITTQEGDTVQLKIKTREAATADAAEFEAGDKLLRELTLSTENTTKISFVVNGNLNADELAAINSVIEQAGSLAQDFFDGDLDNAFAAAQALDINGTQLANVGLRMSVREQLTYSTLALPRPAATPPPVSSNVSSAPAAGPVAEREQLPSATGATDTSVANTPNPAVASVPATPINEQPPVMVNALDLIKGFLNNLLERLESTAPAASGSARLDLSLKLKIFQSTLTAAAAVTPSSNDARAPLPPLVPDTLDALAARQEPPLHAVA